MPKSSFVDQVLKVVKIVPKGSVVSYGQVAYMIGLPRAARQVGWVLNQHGGMPGIPWWRVINNSGRISIKHAAHLPHEQRRLLESEGVSVSKDFSIDIKKYRFKPPVVLLKQLELPDDYISEIERKFGV
jgi:methylated-DNA-protein-cysteine methyltransferase related protein